MSSLPGGRRVALRVHALRERGFEALEVLPTPRDLAAQPAAQRRARVDALRVELYALCTLLADAAVRRADEARPSYPPYGLAHSRFSEWGMVLGAPDPFEAGSLEDYTALWKAFVDTVVFQLHATFQQRRALGLQWAVERLEQLLPLLRIDADARTSARLRDGITFLYGGLQFGTSVSVQLVEVMTRVLGEEAPELDGARRADIVARSSRPAYALAGMNFNRALPAYQRLLDPPTAATPPGWLRRECFALRTTAAGVLTVDVAESAGPLAGRGPGDGTHEADTSYSTLGCPARIAPAGGQTPIATLWRWVVDVAAAAGLLQ